MDDKGEVLNELSKHYSQFKVTERILLTGHSHQAWPDCAFDGITQAWKDAAECVDDKWPRALAKATEVRNGFAALMDDTSGYYSLAANTHDLLICFLSALPLRQRRRIVTTDSEFHSMRRQLQRLHEEGLEVVWVPVHPVHTLADRMIEAIDDNTACVMMSAVFYNSGQIAPDLKLIYNACQSANIPFLVDVYHALNVVPFTVKGLESAFILGGGYKYCQLGEGNCFLRFPKGCEWRPVITGWLPEFNLLEGIIDLTASVSYPDNDSRFEGSTYDPASHYRAAEVFQFFKRQQLTPDKLRQISQSQVRLICDEMDKLQLPETLIHRDREIPLEQIGGFVAYQTSHARELSYALKARLIYTDYRGTVLRFGPAPYLSDEQIVDAIATLGKVIRENIL